MERLKTGLETLAHQHSALVQSLVAHSHFDPASLRRGTLPTAREDDEVVASPKSAFSTVRSSHRLSSHSELSVWYDAIENDGAEEFVLEDPPPEESQASQLSDAPSTIQPSTSISSQFSYIGTSDDDSDSDDVLTAEAETAPSTAVASLNEQSVVRRTHLPSPVVGDEGSLFAVLKKNVGRVCAMSSIVVPHSQLYARISPKLPYLCLSTSL